MAKSGVVMNYDFGPKRHWRRWVWNRIAERVENPRDALCIYLAGAKDYDRPVAMSKGFRSDNLIAVERDAAARAELRGSGVLTVDADIFDVVDSQATRRRIDVVFADLCCGYQKRHATLLFRWMQSPYFAGTVFAFNLLRGRDKEDNGLRAALTVDSSVIVCETEAKHRGAHLVIAAVSALAHDSFRYQFPQESADGDPLHPELIRLQHAYLTTGVQRMRVATESYRSALALQTFDTVIFKMPTSKGLDESVRRMATEANRLLVAGRKTKHTEAAARSFAATLAHRSRRII